MKTLIVGGNIKSKMRSGCISKLASYFFDMQNHQTNYYNNTIPTESVKENDLVIWAPDFPNDWPKVYPVKKKGAVLICTKVMRQGYTRADAVSRIFKMHGNAVIAIYKDRPRKFVFELIDALGNLWIKTSNIESLALRIDDFYSWSASQKRESLKQIGIRDPIKFRSQKTQRFIDLNVQLAEKIKSRFNARYFGNFSTRCMALFPTMRSEFAHQILVSPRNTNKQELTTDDFVLVDMDKMQYYGDRKPSVDTPIQIHIYKNFDDVNYMIHGHAFIKNAPQTYEYYPCGDMREAYHLHDFFNEGTRVVNLKMHGFLIAAKNLDFIEHCIENMVFVPHELLTK
jgi:hypothetical protein